MPFAEKIVDRALRKTGSTWITQEDLERKWPDQTQEL